MSFKYRLEASAGQHFAGGMRKIVTRQQLPDLHALALHSLTIEPGGLRELHWHTNAGELNYCLQGQGVAGIFTGEGNGYTMEISAGSATFVPLGATHYIRNIGSDLLRVMVAFSHEEPEHLDFSETLAYVPREYLAQTFGQSTEAFPALPNITDRFLVKMNGQTSADKPDLHDLPATQLYTANVERIVPKVYEGGTVHELSTTQIPGLSGITVFALHVEAHGLREPHWHPNANELNYCVRGAAQVGIVAPGGSWETMNIEAGDVLFVPLNYFHYIASISDEPLDLLTFFSHSRPAHIDLTQQFDYFAPELLAASYKLNPKLFKDWPRRGDVFLAGKQPHGV